MLTTGKILSMDCRTNIFNDEKIRFARAIEAEVLQAQEPAAWMSPGKERIEFSRPDTVYGSHTIPLYHSPQPPAPCQCAELRAEVERLTSQNEAINNTAAGLGDINNEKSATIAQQAAQIKGLGEAMTRQHNSGEEIAAQCMRAEEKVEQQAARIAEIEKERNSNLRMFQAAILDLASISEELDCDPDEGGAAPIIEAIDELKARIADQSALIDRLKQEARMHAQEARTANSTIAEIYQAISGATGEPGNWRGAEPVRAYIKEKAALIEKCDFALTACRQYPDFDASTGPLTMLLDEAIAAIAAQKCGSN